MEDTEDLLEVLILCREIQWLFCFGVLNIQGINITTTIEYDPFGSRLLSRQEGIEFPVVFQEITNPC